MDKIPSKDQSSDKLHILDYWRIIRVRLVTIVLVFLLTAVTTTVVTFSMPKTYMSLSRISIEKDTSDIAPLLGMQSGPTAFDPYFIQTEFEKIQSQMVLDKVVAKCSLTEEWKLPDDIMARKRLKKAIDVRQFRNTSIIELRAYDRDKNLAQQIAQSLAEEYQTHRTDAQQKRVQKGINVLEDELKSYKEEIGDMQADVDKLRVDLGISDAAGDESYSIIEPEIVRRYESGLIDARALHTSMSTLLDGLKLQSLEELRDSISTAYPDAQLDVLIRELHTGQQTLANHSIDLGELHPRIKGLEKVVATLEQQIDKRIQGVLAGLELKVRSASAQVEQLQRDVTDAKKRESDMRKKGRDYFDAKRALANKTRIRDTILFRVMQEKVDLALPKESTVEITDEAEVPKTAIRPNIPLNIALGVVVGLILGVGLAFFIEYLDTSVKTIDDVERALGAAVLGVIPQNVGSLLDEGDESPHAEAYRVLRTNILFAGRKDESQTTFSVVSGGAGEGKTTTMFNLAVVFAQMGDRILIVDSDLRRPSMHRYMNVSNNIGLTNYLLGQATIDEVIQTTELPSLHFIPSGKLPSSSMGILSSAKMKEFVAEMKSRYDYVFLDAPPIMGVSDASVLASMVDMCVLVVQYRKYPQLMTQRAKGMVTKVGGELVGVVLNNINISQDSYYYYYSGYYYDYYYKSREKEESADETQDGEKEVKLVANADIGGEDEKPKY